MSFRGLLNRTADVVDVGGTVTGGILDPGDTPVASDVRVRVVELDAADVVYDQGGAIVTDTEILTDSDVVALGHELTIDGDRYVVSAPPRRQDGRRDAHHYVIPARKIAR